MNRVYEGLNKVIICETQKKRPHVKRTNEVCLQLSWKTLHFLKSMSFFPSIESALNIKEQDSKY